MKLFHIILHLLRKKSVFQRREQLPQKAFSARNLSFTPQRWFCTDDFKQQARNHCAAVCIMNAMLYYKHRPSFESVHHLIGNGPVFHLRKAKEWFYLHKIRNTEQLESALAAQLPCALLLSTPRHEWHWVLVTGIREYPDGSRWLCIADGWHSDDLRFYRLQQEHDWLSCVALELK